MIKYDGPAADTEGRKYWWLNGLLHRVDGPAVEYPDGSKKWCVNGELHREDGPAIKYADGSKQWWLNGKLHREDGPAIEDNMFKQWHLHGKYFGNEKPDNWKELVVLMQIEKIMNE